ncbi:MAG: triose-phosphate isomerase [Candidatus Omnitrophica bacterium]|nr:triose-phosphate isomerase [Candidatus Omnitrophota bacterium]
MRRPVIAGNWKMYKDLNEAVELASGIRKQVQEFDNVDKVIAPPFVNLTEVAKAIADSNVYLAAQNCHWEKEGAFTGEVSARMLKSIGCRYIIIGHSERRQYFGETNETVNLKIKAAVANNLIPIMCVGETLQEREEGRTVDVVKSHVTGGLKGFTEKEIDSLIIAYEPVWAIGTGKTATPKQAQEVHRMIRGLVKELYSETLAKNKRILYGGSVKPENIEELMKQEDIDGGLIGGASLKIDSYVDMVRKTSELYEGK